jgi:hypothetical protein
MEITKHGKQQNDMDEIGNILLKHNVLTNLITALGMCLVLKRKLIADWSLF